MTEPIVVLQVRTNSTRLPAKALLPILGMPTVLFSALRAMNIGHNLIAAIPEDPTDDILADTLQTAGIPFARGSLNNVCHRIFSSLSDYDDRQCVVRITADNILADGGLINKLFTEFSERRCGYLSATGHESGLPRWGTGVEIFTKGVLRYVLERGNAGGDFGEVAPQIKAKFGDNVSLGFKKLQMQDLRCAIDTFDDYIMVNRALSGLHDAQNMSYTKMLSVFAKHQSKAVC